MATLISPGVSVDIIDESFYASAGAGTIPLIVIATGANKTAPSGSTAAFTTPATAGTLFLATSQLELTTNYGVPYFATSQGTVLHGNETNEWGLMAAYSYLGISNRAYILRADIDTSQLNASAVAPTGAPIVGTYWLNLSNTVWGVFQSNGNAAPGLAWNNQVVLVPTVSQVDSNFVPLTSFGNNGNFAVVPWITSNLIYEKGIIPGNSSAGWYQVGTANWAKLYPTQILGSTTPASFAGGSQISINGTVVTIGVSGTLHLSDVITAINTAAIPDIAAAIGNGGLLITNTAGGGIVIADVAGGPVLTAMGVTAGTYAGVSYYQTSDAQYPDGSVAGSVWIKGNPSRNGASWTVEYYSGSTSGWATLTVPFYPFNSTVSDGTPNQDAAANAALGGSISIGSVYIGYDPVTGVQQPRRWNGRYWAALSYVAEVSAPTTAPTAGTYWYDLGSSFVADIMVSNGTEWKGYRNVYPMTDPNGCQMSATAPTTQSTGASLVANDLWIDTSDTENYPLLYRWNASLVRWVLVDKTDHTSPFGITFADARQDSGVLFQGQVLVNSASAYNYSSTAISDLALSDYLDPDAPNPELYPAGLMLFNTRASNNTVKVWRPTYFNPGSNPTNFDPNDDYTVNNYTVGNTSFVFPPLTNPGRWVNAVGNDSSNNLLPFMGRKAQRQVIVTAMRALLEANQDIRSELVYFNVMACPGYCELIDQMTTLNTDQKEVSFIVGDTPMRLKSDATSLLNWANNANNVAYTGENGLAPGSYSAAAGDYIGLYYPWGLGTTLGGLEAMMPPSMVALNTIAYNDQVAYPWFAPAGFTRGLVSNVSSVGYLAGDGVTYQPVILNQGQRDILYGVRPSGCQINPIAYIPGRGLVVFGQKTLSGNATALDRINVARLVNYLKYNLDVITKPFLFEQNDNITQKAAAHVVSGFLNGLVGSRAISDYAVECDAGNNTPERINQNELWIDVAVLPLHAVEFIYIPVRILAASTNPITLSGGNLSA